VRLKNSCAVEHLAAQLAAIPGVVAVTLGGSRAAGPAVEGSDWDFGLYYRGRLDPVGIVAFGWPGRVFAPGEWGRVVNGGAWLTIGGTKVDLSYRDLGEVLHWTAAAENGQFEIHREVGYVAGIATYVLAGELALGRVRAGDLPGPEFPRRLRETAPAAWFRLAAGRCPSPRSRHLSGGRGKTRRSLRIRFGGAVTGVGGRVEGGVPGQQGEKRANPVPFLGLVPEQAAGVHGVQGAPPGPGASEVARGLQVGHDGLDGAFGEADDGADVADPGFGVAGDLH
jgi:hypothetical protein